MMDQVKECDLAPGISVDRRGGVKTVGVLHILTKVGGI